MNWHEYTTKFEDVLNGVNTQAPYDDPAFVEYTKLNSSRMNRWMKKTELSQETLDQLSATCIPQKWILITEPWCGDAAHITPFIQKMADASDMIDLEIQHRDAEPFLINDYLTNGGKAIPLLISRDLDGNDLFVWGPRPAECQNLMLSLKETDMSAQDKKAELQKWYNKDKGQTVQKEISSLLEELCHKEVA